MVTDLAARGWQVFPAEPQTLAWVAAVLPLLRAAVDDPGADWRHGRTWMVGVDALANAPDGAVAGVPLAGRAIEAARAFSGPMPLHPAQLSVTRPGYPQQSADETETAHRFRRNRGAAHIDGLMAVGPDKRRFLREPHAWILGIALTAADPGASPLVVWDQSHRRMGDAFRTAGASGLPLDEVDLTDIYQVARRQVFEDLPRIELPLRPGEAVLMHRHLLHGVAPWADGAGAAPEGRAIAYFRPQFPEAAPWLGAP